MVATDLPVHQVVAGRDLHSARAERGIDTLVRDDRHAPLGDRDDRLLPDEVAVALVVGVHRDGDVGKHRRRPRGRDRQVAVALGERIADPGQRVVHVDVAHLEVRHSARAPGAPVHDPRPAVDVALVREVDEEAHHRACVLVVHREAVAPVVEGSAKRPQLLHDLAAVVADELPAQLHEALAADVLGRLAVIGEPASHHRLQRDPGVVVSGLPESVEVAHAVPADEDVLRRGVQRVPHVQPVGHVRRRQADHERRPRIVRLGVVEAFLFPDLLPACLDSGRRVARLHRRIVRPRTLGVRSR